MQKLRLFIARNLFEFRNGVGVTDLSEGQSVTAEFFLSITDFFLSFTSGHLCISPVCSEQLMCYVLLVIQLLSKNGFFPLCYGFFFLCVMVYVRAVV